MSRKYWCGLSVLALVLGVRGSLPLAAQTSPQLQSAAVVGSAWVNVTGNLANMASECGNLTLVSVVPGSNRMIAGVALKGLWANDSGTTWTHLGSGAGSDTILNRPSWITYDPIAPGTFWESGIYQGGGIFKTTDNGSTFHQLGTISHNDYVSVDFADPNRQTLVAGGHEQVQTVYRSTNGGQTWTNVGANLPGNTNFSSSPLLINAQTYVVNMAGWGSGASAVYRTTNGGTSWQQVSTQGPVGPPLVTSTGTIYWPWGNSLLKSTNAGASWTQVGSNGQLVRPVELPDGTLVSAGFGNLRLSTDGGSTWTPFGPALPYAPATVVYSPGRQAFFISHWDCGGVVLPDAVMRLDYTTSVQNPLPSAPVNFRISQ